MKTIHWVSYNNSNGDFQDDVELLKYSGEFGTVTFEDMDNFIRSITFAYAKYIEKMTKMPTREVVERIFKRNESFYDDVLRNFFKNKSCISHADVELAMKQFKVPEVM